MPCRFAPGVVCVAWLTATAAMAQAAAPPPGQTPPPSHASGSANTVAPVTVRAPRLTRSQALKTSETFVRTYAAPTVVLDQYARWRGPVCVLVTGLVPDEAAIVASRIDDVAKALGLKVGRPGCRANIEIVFTDQPQGLLDSVARRRDWMLGYHYPSQTKALKTVTRPVQAWYMTASLGGGANNVELAFANTDAVAGTGGGSCGCSGGVGIPDGDVGRMETPDTPEVQPPNGCGDSRFSSCRSSWFENVLVVVDSRRLRGQTLGPVTDYLAMLALSQPRSLDGCMVLPSVIDLFAPAACPGRDPPDGLTPTDAAYLTALYAADPESKKMGQQSEMAAQMAAILVNAGPLVRTAHDGADTSSPGANGH